MLWTLLLCVVAVVITAGHENSRPHIVLIIADDLGWNDVGFHGSNQIPTPNIDALAFAGVVLQNKYLPPICTPSRAALMTGKYPIHTGMQHNVLRGMEPRGLPLSEKILPQYLKELGYRTHLVGKWHLGFYKKDYEPRQRGFDTHTGFVTGKIDMYDHTNQEHGSWGFDFRSDNELVAHDLFGQYATDIFTEEAIRLIENHNKTSPMFLMVSHAAVHTGNPYEFIRAPEDVVQQFTYIEDPQRQKYAGVLSKLDESVGKVIEALETNGLLENSIVLFTTDNGGAPEGFLSNYGSNYPLRGVKNTLWEGGVRGAAALFHARGLKRARIATQTMHMVDWLPTLYHAAGGDTSVFENIDGINQWEALTEDLESNRTTLLHNIDDIWGSSAITVDQWKVIKGTNYNGTWDQWYGPSGRQGSYDPDLIYTSTAGQVFSKLKFLPDKETISELREAATINCKNMSKISCNPLESPCLFNIAEDPCEQVNLADKEPEILQKMLSILEQVNKTAVPPNSEGLDPRGDPKHWGRVYVNFGDYDIIK